MLSKPTKKLFLFFSSFLSIAGSYAQEPWSLKDCIDYAMENNIQIKQQEILTEINSNDYTRSKINLLPDLNAGSNLAYSFGLARDEQSFSVEQNQNTTSLDVNLRSNLTLFNGFRQLNTIRRNELNLLASFQDLEKLKNDISLNIAAAYLQILFNIELVNTAEKQLEITRQQVERTRKLVDAGSLARGRLLEIQAQAASEELQLVEARNQLDLSYLNLAQILDLDSIAGFEIEIPVFASIDDSELLFSVRETYREAMEIMPRIKSAELNKDVAEKDLVLAKGGRSPSLSLSAVYFTSYYDFRQRQIGIDSAGVFPVPVYSNEYPMFDQFKDFQTTVLTFGLSIPIFNGWQVNNNIKNAELNLRNAQLSLQNTRQLLLKDIQQAYADALAAQKKYHVSVSTLTAVKESFKYTEQRFEVGLVNAVEYNTAKTQLSNTESDLLQAKYEYIFKTKILDFYRGNPIAL